METAVADVKDSPYAVKEGDIQLKKEPPAPQIAKIPVIQESVIETVASPQPTAVPVPEPEPQEEHQTKRPLHQRLFGHQDQPAIVPIPPSPQDEPSPQDDLSPVDEAAVVLTTEDEIETDQQEEKLNEAD